MYYGVRNEFNATKLMNKNSYFL